MSVILQSTGSVACGRAAPRLPRFVRTWIGAVPCHSFKPGHKFSVPHTYFLIRLPCHVVIRGDDMCYSVFSLFIAFTFCRHLFLSQPINFYITLVSAHNFPVIVWCSIQLYVIITESALFLIYRVFCVWFKLISMYDLPKLYASFTG